ncbi:hypothetical protein [Nocardia sp. NPDC050710]|uniref:hypothetical protein n=1 Tax=Nocardia sp. NPDC050710 TaxID=3157220 RepID=UPI0033FA30EC
MTPSTDPLRLRLTAAAAAGAIRIALEQWAADPTVDSPADLAIRCMREFGAGLSR